MRILTLESLIFVTGGVGDRGAPQDPRQHSLDHAQRQQQQQVREAYRPASPLFNFWK